MIWYWYVAHTNELFVDLDHNDERTRGHIRQRLQGAIECDRLKVKGVWCEHTESGHAHLIVQTHNHPFVGYNGQIARAVWEIVFHSDIYRGCNNIMRVLNNIPAADILISKRRYNFRPPDATCECVDKHTARVMEHCLAAMKFRGDDRVRGFFGKPSKNPCLLF